MLEIGPGEGALACRLAVGRSYTGVELSRRTRELTARRLMAQGTPGRLVGSLAELPPHERFDLVCAFEVLEHIEEDDDALREWASWLRPGGLLILSTPADPRGSVPTTPSPATSAATTRRPSPSRWVTRGWSTCACSTPATRSGIPSSASGTCSHDGGWPQPASIQVGPVIRSAFADHTEQSSSLLQPPRWSGTVTRLASAPGRRAQRRRPDRGTGLVLFARAPS